jgi:REP element-mobilizing transposase RayT
MSTYHAINFHIVFSTKNRKPWIKDSWMPRLHEYLGGITNGLGARPLKIGGVADHVHLLVGCKPTHRPCDLVREIKKSATSWIHTEIEFEPFCWQDGYSIFSISPDACGKVSAYLAIQAEHHRKQSFRDELVAMLEKAGVPYDPKFLL